MTNLTFDNLAKYAAAQDYLNLSPDGGLKVNVIKNDKFSSKLSDYLHVNANGQVLESGIPGPKHDPNNPDDQFVVRARQARLETAKKAMERGWKNLGGPSSVMGLPLNGQIEIKEIGNFGQNGYQADFRGGTLTLQTDGMQVESETEVLVNIDLVGIECQIRQEKTDEMYGVISVLGASNTVISSQRFPGSGTISMGPDGMRINNDTISLVKAGVRQNYYIWASLIENDSGDVDVIAKNIVDKFTQTASSAVGALTGLPAESVADSESFKENMATSLGWVLGNVLGMGDDPYNAESFNLYWGDLKSISPMLQPAVHRNDDPRTIDTWTHSLILSGVDDGGDRGQYALYFNVWTEVNHSTVRSGTN
jgi:hypothetical protein